MSRIQGWRARGQGTYTFADGSVYTGAWANGKRNGQGIMTYPDGVKYEGEFSDGLFSGQGTYNFANGSVYTGAWQTASETAREPCAQQAARSIQGHAG